jgi:CPA1 family monovalent cation:H+ antiporter
MLIISLDRGKWSLTTVSSDAIRRRLFLAEKAALGDALRKRIVPEDLVQSYVKGLDEKLLSLDDD